MKFKASIPKRFLMTYLPALFKVEEQLVFKHGQTIFYAGHKPYGLYLVRSGKVGLMRSEKVIERIKLAGDIFGEESFFSGKPYGFTAKALEDVRVSFFPKSFLGLDSRNELQKSAL